jgi:hypothetical protein
MIQLLYSVPVVSTRYPYDLVVDSWISLVQTKQRDDETVLEYTKQFLSANDMHTLWQVDLIVSTLWYSTTQSSTRQTW